LTKSSAYANLNTSFKKHKNISKSSSGQFKKSAGQYYETFRAIAVSLP